MFDQVNNTGSSMQVCVQIENMIQFAIAAGELKPGDQLPSTRELAERLATHPYIVAKAYRDLAVMGYLFSYQGKGAFVQEGIEAECAERCHTAIISKLHEIVPDATAIGISAADVKKIVRQCHASNTRALR